MPLNLPNEAARIREAAAQVRLMVVYERAVMPKLTRMFRDTAKATAQAYQEGGSERVRHWLADFHADDVRAILNPHWRTVAEVFGGRLFNAINGGKSRGQRRETKEMANVFEFSLYSWIETEGAALVSRIAETTRTQLQQLILECEEVGMGIDEIAAVIRREVPEIGAVRSEMIARTETHNAATWAGEAAIDASGLVCWKIWLAVCDKRTRPSHNAANGQRRRKGEDFSVGGASMPRPGVGPASQVVRCRCVLVYEEE